MTSSDEPPATLDPADWDALRSLAHRMVDDALDRLRDIGTEPAWRAMPADTRAALSSDVPLHPTGAEAAYQDFLTHVRPFALRQIHPRWWGWVNGSGTPVGMLGDLLTASLNVNAGGFEEAASHVEDQLIGWLGELLDFRAPGVLVSGGSVANLVALAAAREARGGGAAAADGIRGLPPLTVYASTETHSSVHKAAATLGLGRTAVREVPVDADFAIQPDVLEGMITADRAAGARPICVVANAGTVNTGAFDDLEALADLCRREALWLHVDGAFGALAQLVPELRPLTRGMARADSLAFDLHKWLHAPVGAGCILIRDRAAQRSAFASGAAYLAPFTRGPASGTHVFGGDGPELTRRFRGLSTWFALKALGADAHAAAIAADVAHARHLAERVDAHPALERLAPVPLNIVCFRYRGLSDVPAPPSGAASAGAAPADSDDPRGLNALNRELLMRLQERGLAVPSSTVLNGRFALRASFTNHRTTPADVDALVAAVVAIGSELEREA